MQYDEAFMATIYLDKQSRNWKLKTTIEGRDSRPPLRKATDAEWESWNSGNRDRPTDLAKLAMKFDLTVTVPTATLSQNGTDEPPEDLFGFMDWFLRDYVNRSRTGSVVRMTGILGHFRRFIGENNRRLVDVDESLLEAYFQWRIKQTDPRLKQIIKGYTAVSEMELMSGMFTSAIDREIPIIKYNPLTRVLRKLRKSHPRPNPEDETKYLDPDQVRDFLDAVSLGVVEGKIPSLYADLARIMLATGMRVGATCSLEWSWIGRDWTIKIPQPDDKSKFGYSTIVADLGQEVLTRLRAASGGVGRVFPDTTPDSSFYYLRKICRHYNQTDRFKDKLNDKAVNHCLRHSFGTALVDAEVPDRTIGSLLGQRNLKTTQRYAKAREKTKQNAVAKLKFG